MNDKILEQARLIHGTVRLLKTRIISRYMAWHSQRDAAGTGAGPLLDLTEPQANMLMVIREHAPVTVKALAENLRVSPASASAMVDRLVEMGALTREQSLIDRRQVVIEPTELAIRSLEEIEAFILESIAELIEKLGPEDAQKWNDVYAKLGSVLRDEATETKRADHARSEVI